MAEVILTILMILLVPLGLFLIAVILLQESKSGGLSGTFGGAGESLLGARAGRELSRWTMWGTAVFVVLLITIGILCNVRQRQGALTPGTAPAETKTEAPAKPAEGAAATAPEAKPAEGAAQPAPEAKPAEAPAQPAPEAKPVEAPAQPAPEAKPVEAPAQPAPEAKPAEAPAQPAPEAKPAEGTATETTPAPTAPETRPAEGGDVQGGEKK